MNTQLNTYYADQLMKLGNPHTPYQTKIKLTNDNAATNYISLNDESAPILSAWLDEHYNTGHKLEIPSAFFRSLN